MGKPFERKPMHVKKSTPDTADEVDVYSTDDRITQEMKQIEARWWPRELALMQELAMTGMLSTYVRATRQHRRRSHSGRSLPHPWHLSELGGDWWLMFHRTEATVLQQYAQRNKTIF